MLDPRHARRLDRSDILQALARSQCPPTIWPDLRVEKTPPRQKLLGNRLSLVAAVLPGDCGTWSAPVRSGLLLAQAEILGSGTVQGMTVCLP